MALFFEIKKCEEVAANTVVSETLTPANGEIYRVESINFHAGFSSDTTICLVWDYQGASEEVLYSSHGDAVVNAKILNMSITGDGTKKLAIVLDNQTASASVLNGIVSGMIR